MYLKQVRIVKAAKASDKNFTDYEGIKNESLMSNFIEMPKAVILEYMHLCLEGFAKRQLDFFFNSKYHFNPFYLNNKIDVIDNLLKKCKYTSSFSRTQRSITYHNMFKDNEYRNLFFYSLIYILNGSLEQEYYEHFIQYILLLRI